MLSMSPYCHTADEFNVSPAVNRPLSIIAFFVFVFSGEAIVSANLELLASCHIKTH